MKQKKAQPRGRCNQRWTRRGHSHASSGHRQSTQRTFGSRGWVVVDVRAVCANPEGWEFVLGSHVPEGVPGGFQDTQGDRGACLTLEVGSELHGLARPRVLADHLLEANTGDLDQVSCGEGALIPGDLVDGACGDRVSFTRSAKAKRCAACALFPPGTARSHLCTRCSGAWNALP